MSWSLGEARALAVKAARGTGFSWGLAEEAGFTVYWLHARGHPGISALGNYLKFIDSQKCDPIEVSATCPIISGTILMDKNTPPPSLRLKVVEPILMVPFIASVLEDENGTLKSPDFSLHITSYGLKLDGNMSQLPGQIVDCHWQITKKIELENDTRTRVGDNFGDAIATLEYFASRTYAPATQASRIAGAGAGLNDND